MIRYRRYAAKIAGSYLIIGILYILVSDRMAAYVAPSIHQLHVFQTLKGVSFIVLTAIGLFLFSCRQLREVTSDAAQLLRNRDVLQATERRVTTGIFATYFANRAIAWLNALRRDVDPLKLEPLRDALSERERQVQEIRQQGIRFAAGDRQRFDLCRVIRNTLEIVQMNWESRWQSGAQPEWPVGGLRLKVEYCPPVFVDAYPSLLHRAVMELATNAAEACRGRGQIQVHVSVRAEANEVAVEVHDSGPGISVDQRDRVFDPFQSSKGDVAGLGLMVVHACALLHGGRVEISSSHLGGARVEMAIPLKPLSRASA